MYTSVIFEVLVKVIKKVLCETVDWRQIPHKCLLLLLKTEKRKGATTFTSLTFDEKSYEER